MELTRLIVKGGVISPGELKEIVTMSMEQELETISFGSRQDIIFFLKDLRQLIKKKWKKIILCFLMKKAQIILFRPMFR